MAAEHVMHMQKALDQMNLQIHRVLNDITGLSRTGARTAVLAVDSNRARKRVPVAKPNPSCGAASLKV